MSFLLLSSGQVEKLHDIVLNPGELSGRARDKSLEGALSRVENRLIYGMVNDVFELAAAYAQAIARGHCFNDGNKRTAYQTMIVCLKINGTTIKHDTEEAGTQIIALAHGLIEEDDLAAWLRIKAR